MPTRPPASHKARTPDPTPARLPEMPADEICRHSHCGGYIGIVREFTRDVDFEGAICLRCARQYALPADPSDECPMDGPEAAAAVPSKKARREGRRAVPRQQNLDDLARSLRVLVLIEDRPTFQKAVLKAVMPYWDAAHPERPGARGGGPKLSLERVRKAWEQVYGELGLSRLLMLSWDDLVGRMQKALGPMKKGKKRGCAYSASAITPHLRACISATCGQGIPDEDLRERLRGKKHWFTNLKAWLSMREAITPNSDVDLRALQGPAYDKVLHGTVFEAELKDDLTAIQRLYRRTRRPNDR